MEHNELLERLQELAGGEADRFKTYPTEDFSEDDRLFAEFAEASGLNQFLQSKGLLDEEPRWKTVELSEQEDRGEAEHREGRPLIGPEEFLRIADEDTGELPPGKLREDAELHEALRAQAEQEHFGGPDPSDGLTDDEVWAEYRRILGMEEGS